MVQNPATTSDQVGRDFHFRRAWIRERQKASPSLLRVMTIQGDSMIPRLQDGNVVLVDMTQRSPNPPRFFVLYDGMGLVAKRLEFIPMNEPPKVCIIADNQQYSTYDGTADEVNSIGRVRWYGREM